MHLTLTLRLTQPRLPQTGRGTVTFGLLLPARAELVALTGEYPSYFGVLHRLQPRRRAGHLLKQSARATTHPCLARAPRFGVLDGWQCDTPELSTDLDTMNG